MTPKVVYFLKLCNKLTAGQEFSGSREASIGRCEIPEKKRKKK